VHDDLDITLNNYKFQFAKSPKDHKGVISIENHLGTTKFFRLRIGIDNRGSHRIEGEEYVLRKFTEDELVSLYTIFDSIPIVDVLGNN